MCPRKGRRHDVAQRGLCPDEPPAGAGWLLARQSEGDCIGRADVEPSRAPTMVIGELVGAMAGGLNLKGKATFERGF
jgi:hypothetical protein